MDAVQKKVKQFIEIESEFLYNFIVHMPESQRALGILGLFPFLSVYVDGVPKWYSIVANRSIPFTKEEKQVYSSIRQGIKLFENDIKANVSILKDEMNVHEETFLPDYFGDLICDGHIIGNSYLTGIYINISKLRETFNIKSLNYGDSGLNQLLKNVACVGGKIIEQYATKRRDLCLRSINIDQNDLFLFNNSKYRIKELLDVCYLNLLCQINYILYFLNKLTNNRDFFVFRCAYIVYYYALGFIEDNIEINADNKWKNTLFRNAIAHYGIKMALGKNKLIPSDIFGGLTKYYFNLPYNELYDSIINELFKLSSQLEKTLINNHED